MYNICWKVSRDPGEFIFFMYFSILKTLLTLQTYIQRKRVVIKTEIWFCLRSGILHFSVKYKFGTKIRSNWSRSVSMYSFKFFLKKPDPLWNFCEFSKKLKLKRKFSKNYGKKYFWTFSHISTISVQHKWKGTRLL